VTPSILTDPPLGYAVLPDIVGLNPVSYCNNGVIPFDLAILAIELFWKPPLRICAGGM
jgi:hypothetical protein